MGPVTDASILMPQARDRQARDRRARARWPWPVAVIALAAAAAALAGLGPVGRSDGPPLLRASFVGARGVPEVLLETTPPPAEASQIPQAPPDAPNAPDAPPSPAAPAARVGPIDVPADSYAPEEIVEIGTLEIPKLGVRQRLMYGVTLRNIDLGPSLWPGTAMPGQPGNAVVAGHRVSRSRPFRNIDQLVPGDEVILSVADQRSTYRVASSFIVTPDRVDIADPTATPMLTMFACHPPGSARLRIVVRADLVSPPAV